MQHSAANQTRLVERFYIRFATLPSADTPLATCQDLVAPDGPCVRFQQSDSKIYAAVGSTLGATGVSVTTGQWYRIDVDFNVQTGGSDLCDVKVDGTSCGQATATGAAAGDTVLTLGVTSICTADVYYDDMLLSLTAADYPIGAGYIKSYIPDADGSHNVAGANDFERSATGTDITNATTDAFQLINDRPIKSGTLTEYINGIAPPNATDYVEWQYEDSAESVAPRAVEAILTLSDAATSGANACTITLRESGGGTSADIFTGDTNAPGAGTAVFKRAHFATVPGTATAWDTTKFNALRSRFLVSDAAPDPWVGSAMLEAEFPDSGVTVSITGVTATATADGVVGSITAIRIVSVTGEIATATADGIAGSVRISVTGIAATATADGQIGTVKLAPNIAGVTTTAPADGQIGSVAAVRIVSISGTTATATADGQIGAVSITFVASITGVTATATADGQVGSVTAIQIASITGVSATATADGQLGTIRLAPNVAGVTATATADGIAGAVTAVRIVSVTGVAASATADGQIGTMQLAPSIAGVTTTATADGIAGSVSISGAGNISIVGVTATATADGQAGSVTAVQIVSIAGITASATADGIAGTVTAARASSITGVTGTATAAGIAGSATAQVQASITGVTGTATADGIAGVLAAVQVALINGQTATATALAYAGIVQAAGAPTPNILYLNASYVPLLLLVASLGRVDADASYIATLALSASVERIDLGASYVPTQILEGVV